MTLSCAKECRACQMLRGSHIRSIFTLFEWWLFSSVVLKLSTSVCQQVNCFTIRGNSSEFYEILIVGIFTLRCSLIVTMTPIANVLVWLIWRKFAYIGKSEITSTGPLLRTHRTVRAIIEAVAVTHRHTVMSFQSWSITSVVYMVLPLTFMFSLLTKLSRFSESLEISRGPGFCAARSPTMSEKSALKVYGSRTVCPGATVG